MIRARSNLPLALLFLSLAGPGLAARPVRSANPIVTVYVEKDLPGPKAYVVGRLISFQDARLHLQSDAATTLVIPQKMIRRVAFGARPHWWPPGRHGPRDDRAFFSERKKQPFGSPKRWKKPHPARGAPDADRPHRGESKRTGKAWKNHDVQRLMREIAGAQSADEAMQGIKRLRRSLGSLRRGSGRTGPVWRFALQEAVSRIQDAAVRKEVRQRVAQSFRRLWHDERERTRPFLRRPAKENPRPK